MKWKFTLFQCFVHFHAMLLLLFCFTWMEVADYVCFWNWVSSCSAAIDWVEEKIEFAYLAKIQKWTVQLKEEKLINYSSLIGMMLLLLPRQFINSDAELLNQLRLWGLVFSVFSTLSDVGFCRKIFPACLVTFLYSTEPPRILLREKWASEKAKTEHMPKKIKS